MRVSSPQPGHLWDIVYLPQALQYLIFLDILSHLQAILQQESYSFLRNFPVPPCSSTYLMATLAAPLRMDSASLYSRAFTLIL